MGIWNRAMIVGTCGEKDVGALSRALVYDRRTMAGFHCLCNGGICGLPNWAAENINAVGNLAERGYDANSVAETLEDLAKAAPSLSVKVHVGKDGEADECEATVTLSDGKAAVGPPEIATLDKISDAQMRRNFSAFA